MSPPSTGTASACCDRDTTVEAIKKHIPEKLVFLCCLVYFASYVTRLDYAAVLVEIVRDLEIPKTTAGIAVTGSFITYGIGMILFGFVGDRIKPRTLISVGLLGTALINLAMGILPDIRIMIGVWCFNGFFQAMLWPPLSRTLAENLSPEKVPGAIATVCTVAQIATLAVYLLSPVVIRASGWQTVFLLAAGIGVFAVLLWYPGTAGVRQSAPSPVARSASPTTALGPLVLAAGLIPIMLSIILLGMLRDGLQTWMPTYICEVFGLSTETSILISGLLPVLSVASISLSMLLFRKVRNEVLSGAILFGIASLCAVIMFLTFPGNAVLGVALFSLLAGSMHGANQMIVCSLPLHFEHFGRVSTFAGLLNSFVYVGAAISTYGFASFAERFGWRSTMFFWLVIALLGTLICLFCFRKWKNFCKAVD